MSPVQLQPATPADADALWVLHRAAHRPAVVRDGRVWDDAVIAAELTADLALGGVRWVVAAGDRVGFVQVLSERAGPFIKSLVVGPDHQRRGLADPAGTLDRYLGYLSDELDGI